MADSEIWNAFGSDSSDDDDNDDGTNAEHNENQSNISGSGSSGFHLQQHEVAGTGCNFNLSPSLVSAIDSTVLQITSHFLRLSSLSGVSLQDRVVGINIGIVASSNSKRGSCGDVGGDTPLSDELVRCQRKYHDVVAERVRGRGMKILDAEHQDDTSCYSCDAAILLQNESSNKGWNEDLSCIKRSLLPGGSLWLILVLDGDVGVKEQSDITTDDNSDCQNIENRMQNILISEFPTSIWSIVPSSTVTPTVRIVHLQKHSCVINAWSCPWMNKMQPPSRRLASTYNETEEHFPIMNGGIEEEYENYLQYERRVASALTIVPSVKERCHPRYSGAATTMPSNNDALVYNAAMTTILTEQHVQRACELLQKHGLVIIKGLLPLNQTVPWGEAVLSDFQFAVSRLKCHPTRPVDLLNPQCTSSGSSSANPVFEPLSYKEMAMREDLRVDLRSGPAMENLKKVENDSAVRSMMMLSSSTSPPQELGANNGPTMIQADVTGSLDSWRFHPSILAIIKRVFNPRKESFSKGNFGRWNFGGSGPDGSPQPFRLGQIGSVISCPGSADQAIHADTPHLFEHEDCLPCHYLNVFTPGYHVVDDPNDDCVEHEFTDDGIWTGNSTIGGTAFVYGSHKLSVSAQLLSEEDNGTGKQDHMMVGSMDNATAISATASMRKKMLWLRTLRPSLEAGDVLIFDCRTIHFGLANTSRGDQSGRNAHAGRRPMLYTNVTQSWFHDPKNWDDREKIF